MTRRENGEGSKPILRKDGRWQINLAYLDQDGLAHRTSITGKTESEVRRKRKDIVKRLNEGKPARDKKMTLDVLVEQWITGALEISDRKRSTKALYATVARKHIAGSKLGAHTLDKIKPSSVESWLVELRGKGLAQSSIRTAYVVLRAILDTAVRDGDLGTNPVAVIKRPKVVREEATYLSKEQFDALLKAAEGSRYAPLFELLVNTALRRGEALALQWRDIDFEARTIFVRGTLSRVDGELVVTEPKTEASKAKIPMSKGSEKVLKSLRVRQAKEKLAAGSQWHQTGYVFTTELGEPCDPRNALRAITVAAKRAELPGVGLHTLRHSAASIMLSNGVPLLVVSRICRHSSIQITADTYGHVSPTVAHEAMSVLDAALGG